MHFLKIALGIYLAEQFWPNVASIGYDPASPPSEQVYMLKHTAWLTVGAWAGAKFLPF